MQATLDRVVIAGERVDRDGCGVLEAKNRALRPGVLEDWRAGAPLEIVLQVQHQLAVTGWRWGAIAALVGGRIQIVDVERDDELIALHVDACQRVIEDAASGSEPPADGSASSRRAIGALYPRDDGSVVDLDGGAALTARRLRRYREVAARIKARDDELSNQLRQAMGTHSAGRLPDGSIWTLKRNAAGVRPLVWRKK
jgi:predicted phage-related endonuclease